jgi:hypothetical protein
MHTKERFSNLEHPWWLYWIGLFVERVGLRIAARQAHFAWSYPPPVLLDRPAFATGRWFATRYAFISRYIPLRGWVGAEAGWKWHALVA